MDNPARIPAPNYTQIPNAIFDLMADKDAGLTEKELKVLLAIARKTFGWHKKRDKISLSQLEQLTSMRRASVVAGIRAAIKRGIVRQTPDPNDKRGGVFYELVVEDIDQMTSSKSELVQNSYQSKIHTRTSSKSELELVQNLNTQKKDKEKKEREGDDHTPAHPAIALYTKLTGAQPAKFAADMIAEQVTDLNRWGKVIRDWLASDFKPGNVKGMLDWYHGKGKYQGNNNTNGARSPADLPMITAPTSDTKHYPTAAERRKIIEASDAKARGE